MTSYILSFGGELEYYDSLYEAQEAFPANFWVEQDGMWITEYMDAIIVRQGEDEITYH